eukprot:g2522.t1
MTSLRAIKHAWSYFDYDATIRMTGTGEEKKVIGGYFTKRGGIHVAVTSKLEALPQYSPHKGEAVKNGRFDPSDMSPNFSHVTRDEQTYDAAVLKFRPRCKALPKCWQTELKRVAGAGNNGASSGAVPTNGEEDDTDEDDESLYVVQNDQSASETGPSPSTDPEKITMASEKLARQLEGTLLHKRMLVELRLATDSEHENTSGLLTQKLLEAVPGFLKAITKAAADEGVHNKKAAAKKVLSHLRGTAPTGNHVTTQLISTQETAKKALGALKSSFRQLWLQTPEKTNCNPLLIALDCEGVNLSANGPLTLLQLAYRNEQGVVVALIFDVLALEEELRRDRDRDITPLKGDVERSRSSLHQCGLAALVQGSWKLAFCGETETQAGSGSSSGSGSASACAADGDEALLPIILIHDCHMDAAALQHQFDIPLRHNANAPRRLIDTQLVLDSETGMKHSLRNDR